MFMFGYVISYFRYEVCVPSRSSAEKHNTAAVYHPDSLQEDIQVMFD